MDDTDDREIEVSPARGTLIGFFAAMIVLLAFASGALAQSRYETMHDFAPGLERPMITAIQERLNDFGYRTRVTGSMDRRTSEAIRAYQADAGMPVTGRADQALINQLNFGPEVHNSRSRPRPASPTSTAVADEDRASPQVRWVQERLAAAGYAAGPADGIAGPKTAAAIAQFRRDRNLAPGDHIDSSLIQALGGT